MSGQKQIMQDSVRLCSNDFNVSLKNIIVLVWSAT